MADIRVWKALVGNYQNEFEFWSKYSGISEGTLADHQSAALGKLGYIGTLDDMLIAWCNDIGRSRGTTMDNILNMSNIVWGGLKFYKDYRQQRTETGSNAALSGGSGINTCTVNRSASAPATYFDENGVMQITTTSNVPSFTQGYYDETGWHLAPSWLIEGASTNALTYSINSVDSNSDGKAEGVVQSGATTVTGTPVYTLVDATDISSISGHKWQRVQYTGVAGDSSNTLELAVSAGITPTSFCVQGNKVTFSAILKGSIAGCTFYFQGLEADAAGAGTGTVIQSSAITVYSTPIRVHHTHTIVDAACTRVYFRPVHIKNIGTDDTVDVYFTSQQVELQAYPSSFIPTTTTALQRNQEIVNTYTTSGNFPAPSGGNCLSFDGANASGDDYVSVANSATANRVYGSTSYSIEGWCFVRSDGESDAGRIFNLAVSSGSSHALATTSQSGSNVTFFARFGRATTSAITQTTASIPINTWNHFAVSWDGGDDVAHAPKIYLNGSEASYQGTPTGGTGTLADDTGNAFVIGNTDGTSNTFDGFIQCARIYRNKALSAPEVATAYAAGRYASQPVTGCTAEYLFNEGTGTALTDSVAGNNGTISGATWSKDTYSGSVMIKYRPVMLPSEQGAGVDGTYPTLFSCSNTSTDNVRIRNASNAENVIQAVIYSNQIPTVKTIPGASFSRYTSACIVLTWSTTADSSGYKFVLYFNGSIVGTGGTSFIIPAGSLPTSFSIQPSVGQSAMWEVVEIWDRVLSSTEVTQLTNYLS